MHKCIYLFAGGQGQEFKWRKQGRGDTQRMKHGVPGPSGLLHDVVVGERRIIEEFRDGGDVMDGTEQFRSGRGERKESDRMCEMG